MFAGHGSLRQWAPTWRAGKRPDRERARSPNSKISLMETAKCLADFEILFCSQQLGRKRRGAMKAAVFARGDPGDGLEGAVERAERLEAGIHRHGDHRHL